MVGRFRTRFVCVNAAITRNEQRVKRSQRAIPLLSNAELRRPKIDPFSERLRQSGTKEMNARGNRNEPALDGGFPG